MLTTISGLLPKIAALQEATSPGFADTIDGLGGSTPINSNKEMEHL
jgi:hypothetical protein